MNHGEGAHALEKLERCLSVQERQQQYNTCFNEELMVFTNRVVRAENASANYSTQNCEHPKHKSLSLPSSHSSQAPDVASKGVERIVLQKVYYAMRNSSDEDCDNDLPSPDKHSRQGREQECDENMQRGMSGNSNGYFSDKNFKNSSKSSKKVCERKCIDKLTDNYCSHDHRKGSTHEVRGFSKAEHKQQLDKEHCCSTRSKANHSMIKHDSTHGDLQWYSAPNGFETFPPSSESNGETGVNFAKLRSTVEKAVLEEIRRQIGSTEGTGEAQILVRVARDILSANAKDTEIFETPEDLVERSDSAREITGHVNEEHAYRATKHQDFSQFSTAIDREARPTTTATQLGNYGYPKGTVIRTVHTFKGSKRPGSFGNDRGEDMTRSKYHRKEGMPGFITNERFSPDTEEDVRPAEEVMISARQTHRRQLKSTDQDCVALENHGSLRTRGRNEREEEAESPDGKRSPYLQAGRKDESSDSDSNYSPILSDAIFRFRHSSEIGDEASANELCEDSEQPSPSSDDSVEIYRPSFVYDVHLQRSRGSYDSLSWPEETRSDQHFDSVAVDEASWFPTSIFKQAQSMRQDIHATVRVFSAMFQPFSCSQTYSTSASQQNSTKHPTPLKNISNQFGQTCSKTSQTSTSADEGSSEGPQYKHQMELSGRDYQDSGEQNIQITSVRSLQKDGPFAQNNVQRQKRAFMAESVCQPAICCITEGQLGEKSCVAAEKSPSDRCSHFPVGSCMEDMLEKAKQTEAVYPPASLENLSDSYSTGEGMTMQTRQLPDKLPSGSEGGISRQPVSREDLTLMQTEEAEGKLLLKEVPSYCGHSRPMKSGPS